MGQRSIKSSAIWKKNQESHPTPGRNFYFKEPTLLNPSFQRLELGLQNPSISPTGASIGHFEFSTSNVGNRLWPPCILACFVENRVVGGFWWLHACMTEKFKKRWVGSLGKRFGGWCLPFTSRNVTPWKLNQSVVIPVIQVYRNWGSVWQQTPNACIDQTPLSHVREVFMVPGCLGNVFSM